MGTLEAHNKLAKSTIQLALDLKVFRAMSRKPAWMCATLRSSPMNPSYLASVIPWQVRLTGQNSDENIVK